jgi:hypothetical protein
VRISSRTPEGDAFSCKVCGTVDRIAVSPLVEDAVCTRCGGYLAKFLGHFHGGRPLPLSEDLATLLAGDDLDVIERVMDLEEELGVMMDLDEVQQCRTVEDLLRYIVSLRDGE